tara:strand:+ start:399 stop:2615 length:2217 start_codon:yes stop_codon:yes gene_type:complete
MQLVAPVHGEQCPDEAQVPACTRGEGPKEKEGESMNKKHEVPEWYQLPTTPFSVKEDSNSGEFSEISDDRAVAWEDTQNQSEKIHQLDSSAPIEIVARFKKPVSRKKLEPILTPRLNELLEAASKSNYAKNKDLESRMKAIGQETIRIFTIESFNQKGMTGAVYHDPYIPSDAPSQMSHWRSATQAYGITSDSQNRKGSQGRGKEANQRATESGINIVYSVRHDEEETPRVMMGMMRTCHFDLQEQDGKFVTYSPYAIFGLGYTEDEGQLPIYGEKIDEYADILGFTRKPDESGVSHAMISPKEELKPEAYAQHIVSRFYLGILRGDFNYTIIDEQHNKKIRITSETISSVASKLDWDDQSRTLKGGHKGRRDNFASVPRTDWKYIHEAYAALLDDEGDWISNELIPGNNCTWDWYRPGLFSEESIASARESWDSRREIKLKIKVNLHHAKKKSELCEYRVVMQEKPQKTVVETNMLWSRDGMIIPREGILFADNLGYLAVGDVPLDGLLGEMLRDAEGEGHLKWETRKANVRKNFGSNGAWTMGHETADFVKNTAWGFMEGVMFPSEEAVELVDVEEFTHTITHKIKHIEEEDEHDDSNTPPPCADCGSTPCICIILPPRKSIKCAQISASEEGILRVMRNPETGDRLIGKTVSILTAIENPRRNSFSAYRKDDYKKEDIHPKDLVGCEHTLTRYRNEENSRGGVEILLNITASDWSANILGFPPKRDLDTIAEVIP